EDHGPLPSSGQYVFDTLNRRRSTQNQMSKPTDAGSNSNAPVAVASVVPPAPDVPLNMFAGMSYTDAVLWIAARLADGLAHAHARGILHRDLNPANILLPDEGQPMLRDVNLAEDINGRGPTHLGGTVPYMAPEQLVALCQGPTAAGGMGEHGDLYALGVILFELLTGRYPFATTRGRTPEALNR